VLTRQSAELGTTDATPLSRQEVAQEQCSPKPDVPGNTTFPGTCLPREPGSAGARVETEGSRIHWTPQWDLPEEAESPRVSESEATPSLQPWEPAVPGNMTSAGTYSWESSLFLVEEKA
jgi:hypothetical protein